MSRIKFVRFLLIAALAFGAVASNAAVFNVNSTVDTNDANPGDGVCDDGGGFCTLRAAISEANSLPGSDIINLGAATYELTLSGTLDDLNATGDLDVRDSVTISGAGAASTIIDAAAIDRVFDMNPSSGPTITVTVENLTVQNGDPQATSGIGNGGGFRVHGTELTINNSIVTSNYSPGAQGGGGIYYGGGHIVVTDSTVSENSARTNGGGITAWNGPPEGPQEDVFAVTVNRSTVKDNSAGAVGGVYCRGGCAINNSTVSGNSSTDGPAGVVGFFPVVITNSTVTDNVSTGGNASVGGINLNGSCCGGIARVRNSIVAGNSGLTHNDIRGTYQEVDSSIIGEIDGTTVIQSGANNQTGTPALPLDPLLAPLADNGGPTETHEPLAASTAIDAADDAICASARVNNVDQRGISRPQGPQCDIGAVEVSLNAPPTADAGPDQSARAGDTINLDGTASFDDNTATGALIYAWSFTSLPMGSAATLSGAATATPSFVADIAGTYTVQLIVTDEGALDSLPDEVTISTDNLAPTANAGPDQLVIIGTTVFLDGSASSDPEMDPLSFSWSLDGPLGSTAVLNGDTTATPDFVPDLEGVYDATLTVSDAIGPGAPDTVSITATTAAGFAESQIVAASDLIEALSSGQVTTKGNQNALLNFLNQAIVALQGGDIATAIDKVEKALARTDGCVLRGSVDGDGPGKDWITDCVAQADIYALLDSALTALTL